MTNNSTVAVVKDFSAVSLGKLTGHPLLYDRVINVKLYRCTLDMNGVPSNDVASDYLTIRSDYEVETSAGMSRYRACIQKPSIALSYKVFSGNTAPVLRLRIHNFNPYVSDGTSSTLALEARPFRSVEIHMGYRGQFKDWPSLPLTSANYKSFMALTGDSEDVTVIRGSVLAVTETGMPPDSEVTFEICPATVSCGIPDVRDYLPDNTKLRTTTMVTELYKALEAYKSVYVKPLPWSLPDFQNLQASATFSEVLFYWLISRRYWDSYVSAASERNSVNSNISDYKSKVSGDAATFSANMDSLRKAVAADPGKVDSLCFLPDKPALLQRVVVGTQSLRYDIPVYLAEMLRAEENGTISADQIKLELAQYIKLYADNPEQMLTLIKAQIYPYLGWRSGFTKYKNAGRTISEIKSGGEVSIPKSYPCLLLYDSRNSADEASTRTTLISGSSGKIPLSRVESYAYSFPAVYDITFSAVTTAHTPFFGMFPIMYPVKFDTAYKLTDFVQYYLAPLSGVKYFSCFEMDVDFATVEDRNECTLTMVPLQGVQDD
jgi:hypothetical protein